MMPISFTICGWSRFLMITESGGRGTRPVALRSHTRNTLYRPNREKWRMKPLLPVWAPGWFTALLPDPSSLSSLEVCAAAGGFPSSSGPVVPRGAPTCLAHELLLVVQRAVFLAGLHSHVNCLSFLQREASLVLRTKTLVLPRSSRRPGGQSWENDDIWAPGSLHSTCHPLPAPLPTPPFLLDQSMLRPEGLSDQKTQALAVSRGHQGWGHALLSWQGVRSMWPGRRQTRRSL